MTEELHCNLVGNALDYLLLAGELAQEGSPRLLKHAIATLADGQELLLKSRLEVYDWSLLFKNVDEAERSRFEAGEFQSVTFDEAIKRLKGICGVEVGKGHLIVLNSLRKHRNKIRHFAITADKSEVMSLLTKAYSFALDFVASHLEDHLDDEAQRYLDALRKLLGEFDEFVKSRLVEIQATLAEQNRYSCHVECPGCLQVTLYADGGEALCAFCGYRASGEAAADDWFHRHYGHYGPKETMIMMEDMGLEPCPECGSEATIPLDSEEETAMHCLSCGVTSYLRKCGRCGNDTYNSFCDYCRYQMEKDD